MRKISTIEGIVATLKQANIDTDAIMPKQFLKSIKRTGYGAFLFDAWRYLDKGELGMDCRKRPINPDFSLNKAEFQGATILLTQKNFGCGSSREHAVWGLVEYGFQAIIAPSFADIFFNNSIKNGLLPIVLSEREIDTLFDEIEKHPGTQWKIDLNQQTVISNHYQYIFNIDASDKEKLQNGLDEIGITLAKSKKIKEYEAKRSQSEPWVYSFHT
ncbi:3-isopropylmalate dehydratase small subunit [Candidatus Berkiella cookevillensis]|uniref:3-isopropylmalate dehydratase small subunit n=1 Tax=Candidatus Berkiella cookevillensis TaxID=437022 RepID=A0A0Q9YTJ7_9GAMM|nr:3-isopropylmalate dehydratase small subunit [Candidatus Berkiella cookevillensis]MCS5708918.1 3-isopropylmalate dehydratase small subunit [Candidatus Berkiella cookevillensis]